MKLNELRKEIDEIDWRILKLINQRFKIVPKIIKEKSEHSLPIEDQAREVEISKTLKVVARQLNLRSDFISEIFKLIIKESRKIQTETLSHSELVPGSKLDAELNSA